MKTILLQFQFETRCVGKTDTLANFSFKREKQYGPKQRY